MKPQISSLFVLKTGVPIFMLADSVKLPVDGPLPKKFFSTCACLATSTVNGSVLLSKMR